MANSEVYTFTMTVPGKIKSAEPFKIPFAGRVKQILFQAQSLETMELRFQIRDGGDILFPSNIQLQPIRKWPVVVPVDFEIRKEAILTFEFNSIGNDDENVSITLVIHKNASIF